MEWRANLTIFIFIVLCSAATVTVNAKWCTRSKSEIIQHEVTVTQKCNQTYEDSCSFFSWDTCTFNELVDCQVKKNISVTRYMLTEECCPGYKLDPVNNITCIRSSDGPIKSAPKPPKAWFDPPKTLEKAHVVGKAGPSTSVAMTHTGNNASYRHNSNDGEGTESWLSGESGHAIEDEDDNLLFGLSYGAYAGIICTLLFVLCVCVLIMLRVRKRSKKNAAKGNTTEIEITQKMLNVPA